MKLITTFSFFILLLTNSLFGQNNIQKDTIYLDENMTEISKTKFLLEENSAVFYTRSYETEEMIVHKVLYQFYFGKITSQEIKQIQLLLHRNSNIKIKNDENILIQYSDTLYNYSGAKIKYDNHFIKYHSTITDQDTVVMEHKPYSMKMYDSKNEKDQKELSKCTKKLSKKKNTQAFYIYNVDKGYPQLYENLIWLKDNGTFKNTFFKIIYENGLLIIKPNGDYFLKFGHFSDAHLFKLLKTDDWSAYFVDWEKSIKTNSSIGYGIIKEFAKKDNSHSKHCY